MTNDTNGRVLILSDGGLPSLVAAMHAREATSLSAPGKTPEQIATMLRDNVLLLPFGLHAESRLPQTRAVTHQANVLGIGSIGVGGDDIKPLLQVAPHADMDEHEGLELLGVLLLAARLQCSRVVWPVHAGGHDAIDLDRLSQIADRSLVAAKYASLCSSARSAMAMQLDTPFADLTDRQLADLAIDIDAPIDACWWWKANAATGEDGRERSRWMKALQAMGWSQHAVGARA